MRFLTCLLTVVLNILIPALNTMGEELSLHGFVQGNYSLRTTGEEIPGQKRSDFVLGEERFQLKLTGSSSSGNAGFLVKSDFFHDAVDDDADLDLREAYIDYSSDKVEIRAGRQIITWGVGDLIFINDIFPKDYVAFFSGRPLEYLKVGVDSAKVNFYSDLLSAELVLTPFFERDVLPSGKRFFIFDPFSSVSARSTEEPESTVGNTELALRLSRNVSNFDVSLYAYKGFFRAPAVRPDDMDSPTRLTLSFPDLAVYGASLQGTALGGVISAEAGYLDSLDDHSGRDAAVDNSQLKFLLGYQRPWRKDFTIGLQYYLEHMQRYGDYLKTLPAGFPKRDKLRHVITIRLTQLLKYQTLKLSLFTFYSPSDEDYLVIPEATYSITDNLWVAIGANIFGGRKETTFFGQLDKNDNIYVTLRYVF